MKTQKVFIRQRKTYGLILFGGEGMNEKSILIGFRHIKSEKLYSKK